MGLLAQVTTGKRPMPRRVLLYGTGGIGKSTFGAQAPNHIFLSSEDGLDDIDCNRPPEVQSYDELIEGLSELCVDEHPYRSLVIDTLDWMESLVWKAVCDAKGVGSIEEIAYGKGYMYALDFWREILGGLSHLRSKRRMHIVLLAHSEIERFRNPAGEDFDRYVPKLHKFASALFREWCDEVLFVNYKIRTKQSDAGFGRKQTKALEHSPRVIYTVERPSHIAKNRLGLPEEMPFLEESSWADYATFFPEGVMNNG